ncbi:FAD-dependent oxidoreductase [Bradyrhizobium sp. CCBAU 51627]|uniref:FAD-dependent oxidoreductase n=1 Tax=Bradyrhizobium sp. CCBAU 51627 TaxID=1325088 RepID=UPI0023051897|nr:NAD(P)/FAD-dependent oxidoreductase [Bradyrhizobium sp. CCBAU 51627]MDA9430892.1 pentachlorophenol monooxygenase [Bradyrhizobium sp. CCBAU 51627]
MALPANNEIVIVGAGPVGLALGAELRRLHGAPLLLDRQAESANTSRAAVIHARTLEVLESVGATSELIAQGVKVPIFRVRDRDRVLLEIDFSNLDGLTSYPFTIMCPQQKTEAVLLSRLRAFRGDVQRPVDVSAIDVGKQRIDVMARADDGTQAIQTQWLVGCDGAHSTVREAIGVEFEGGAYEESFVLADVTMDWPLSRDEVSLFFSPAGLVVVAPLPQGQFRIVATANDAPERPDPSFMQHILNTRGPAHGVGSIQEIVWGSRFRLQHRVVTSPRVGRVLLCGDAAHVHSPAGGQGMNTGIQDAVALAGPLLAAVRGEGTAALDDWAARRHEIARKVVGVTDRMTRAATLQTSPARSIRNTMLAMAGHIPGVPDRIARLLAEIDNR